MRTLVIDIADLGSETHPDDRVVLYAPTNRRSPTPGRVTSTARVDVELEDGYATREVEPGPMVVQLQCRGIADTREKLVQVPEGTGEVTLADLLEDVYEYTPEVVAAAQQARNEAVGAARTAAQDAVGEAQDILSGYITRVTDGVTRAEAAADRAEAGANRVGTAEQVGRWAAQAQAGADRVGSAERVLEAESVAVDAAAEAVAASLVSGVRRVDMVDPTPAEIDSTLAALPAGSTVMNLSTGEVWAQ